MEAVHWADDMAKRCLAEGKKDVVYVFVHDAQRAGEKQCIERFLSPRAGLEQLETVTGNYGELASFKVTKAAEE